MAKIGVEETLDQVAQALRERGYEVVTLHNEKDAKDCDCCVVSGQDVNVMGIQDVETEGSVIDARGMSAEQVCEEIEQRLQ